MLMLWDFYVCSLLPMANWAEIQAFVLYLSFEWSLMVNYRWQSWAETALPCCRPDVDLYNCLFYSLTDQSQWQGMSIVLYENAERGPPFQTWWLLNHGKLAVAKRLWRNADFVFTGYGNVPFVERFQPIDFVFSFLRCSLCPQSLETLYTKPALSLGFDKM